MRSPLEWRDVHALTQEAGPAFYVVDDRRFTRNFEDLLGAFRSHYRDTHIGYSYKTNYTPLLCKRVAQLGGYAEVVSAMEYELAEKIGVPPAKIIFNGPAKDASCMQRAVLNGSIVNLDSWRDVRVIQDTATANPKRELEVSLRCNFQIRPEFVSRFGFDAAGQEVMSAREALESLTNVRVTGLHCHFPDRDLASYQTRSSRMLALADALFPDAPPKYMNLGGGYFSDMPESLKQAYGVTHVSFAEYAAAIAKPVSEHYARLAASPTLFIEPGTALVADTFKYYAEIIDVKRIAGRRIATTCGSIFNISASARNQNLPYRVVSRSAAAGPADEATDVVGYTCIEGDVMSRQVTSPIEVGDFIEYSNVGSYSVVMKPPFIMPNVPIIRIADDGQVEFVKRAETTDDVFRTFVF